MHLRKYHEALEKAREEGCLRDSFRFRDVPLQASKDGAIAVSGHLLLQTGCALNDGGTFNDAQAYPQKDHTDAGRDGTFSIFLAMQYDVLRLPRNDTGHDTIKLHAGDVVALSNTAVHAGASMRDLEGNDVGPIRRRFFCNYDRGDSDFGTWHDEKMVARDSPISICSAEFREGLGEYKCRVVHVPTLARLFSMMEAALPVTSHDEDSMDGNAVLSGQSKQQRRRQNK